MLENYKQLDTLTNQLNGETQHQSGEILLQSGETTHLKKMPKLTKTMFSQHLDQLFKLSLTLQFK